MPEMIADNIKSVKQRIAKCCEKCGRLPESVRLVAVTKSATVESMRQSFAGGIRVFGENRVQDALAKRATFGDTVEWHLVGHLQTNKVKDAVGVFSLIHSVDSLKLADAIDKAAAKLGRPQAVLIQVNTSSEESKFGIAPDAAIDFLRQATACKNIAIKGLMTIAPEVENSESVRPYFKALKSLLDKVNASLGTKYETLSMGMTNDFSVAIEEGATIIRIGRAIFS